MPFKMESLDPIHLFPTYSPLPSLPPPFLLIALIPTLFATLREPFNPLTTILSCALDLFTSPFLCPYHPTLSLLSCTLLLPSTPHHDLSTLSTFLLTLLIFCSSLMQHTFNLESSMPNLHFSITSQLIDTLATLSQCLVHTSTACSSRILSLSLM